MGAVGMVRIVLREVASLDEVRKGRACGISSRLIVRVFFFQAEDGIRDLTVTGVQTCALPISDQLTLRGFLGVLEAREGQRAEALRLDRALQAMSPRYLYGRHTMWRGRVHARSGEGRVGEERRSRGGAGYLKKKKKKRIERNR